MTYNMKNRPLATSVDGGSIVFGAKDGQADTAPEPFSLSTVWAWLQSQAALVFDPIGAASASGAASNAYASAAASSALASATAYTDASPARLFVQASRPISPGPWSWWQTDPVTGQITDLTINDGVA